MKISLLQNATFCLLAFGMLAPLGALAQTTDARQELQRLSMATSLDRKGIAPWHLRMSFDLYDIEGHKNKLESGTIEEWWASSKNYRIVIASPSYTETIPGKPDQPGIRSRESYLVDLLLRQVTHPVDDYSRYGNLNIESEKKKFGKVTLTCLRVNADNAPKGSASPGVPEMCAMPDTNILRTHFDVGGFSDVRNRLGNFLNTSVALDNTINYSGRIAIVGHVDQLETYQPAAEPEPPAAETSDAPKDVVRVPGIVGGIRTKYVEPIYPLVGEMGYATGSAVHLAKKSGTVVLSAIITREGNISSLVLVASPDESFSRSAMDAVKQWKYSPYLLNDQPTDIDTMITVNFFIN